MSPEKKIAQSHFDFEGARVGDARMRRNNKRGARAKALRWLRRNA